MNDFDNEKDFTTPDTDDTTPAENEAWEEESDKLFDEMDEAFDGENATAGEQAPFDEDDETDTAFDDDFDSPAFDDDATEAPRKKNGLAIAIVAVLCVAIVACAVFFALRFFGKSEGNGAANVINMGFTTTVGDYTYYIEPNSCAIMRYSGNNLQSAEVLAENPIESPACFLTDIEGELYYVSMTNGAFTHFIDGNNDEIVIDDQCYYPIYVNGSLYYRSMSDYMLYAVPVTNGVFGEPTAVIDSLVYFFTIYEDVIYYISADDGLLYATALDGTGDPVQVSMYQMNFISIANGYIYFMRYPDEANPVTPALCRIPVTDYSVEEVLLDNTYAFYANYYDGYVYYMNYVEATEENPDGASADLYRVKADGSEAPTFMAAGEAMYLQVVDDYVYYWYPDYELQSTTLKRLPVDAVDNDGTLAEAMPGQELFPLTDEPFALEDIIGEENIEEPATAEEATAE